MTGYVLQCYGSTPDHGPLLKLQNPVAAPQSGPADHTLGDSDGTALSESDSLQDSCGSALPLCTVAAHAYAAAKVKEGLPSSVLLYVAMIK